jgi:hypothetical protein
LSKICITANVQENVILHDKTFYFCKTCAETWNLSPPKKLDLRKTKLFHDLPSSFCSRYPNIWFRFHPGLWMNQGFTITHAVTKQKLLGNLLTCLMNGNLRILSVSARHF